MAKPIDVVTTRACFIQGKYTKAGTKLSLEEKEAKNVLASKRGMLASEAKEEKPKSKTKGD